MELAIGFVIGAVTVGLLDGFLTERREWARVNGTARTGPALIAVAVAAGHCWQVDFA